MEAVAQEQAMAGAGAIQSTSDAVLPLAHQAPPPSLPARSKRTKRLQWDATPISGTLQASNVLRR